ncbi:MAG: hypothetical protein LC620_02400, partial [Halobacteriales archaeon]|nr:hypothetical protein [Halobacteriales archaeon]
SGGYADVAGPASLADLDTVIDWVAAHYPTGRVGVVGGSYGGGESYQAWAKDPRVTTAVPMYGWVDLADALIPNNVPKLEWAQFLYTYGLAGSHGRYDAMVQQWYPQIYTRADLATVRSEMSERSALPLMAGVAKPLFLCQGLQETLFPQADRAWGAAGGFTRAYIYTGGHGSGDAGCWDRTLAWMQFFLGGYDTRVDTWPALETVDAAGPSVSYPTFPASITTALHLRSPDLTDAPSDATFTVRQSPGNPVAEPQGLSDLLGGAHQAIPDQLRTDPTATGFLSGPFAGGETILGEPVLTLHVQSGKAPFQATALLLRLQPEGSSQALGHAAFAALNDTDLVDGTATLRFEWTHAALQPGDRIELKVASNDPSWWMPLLSDYSVTFDGTSSLEIPFLQP